MLREHTVVCEHCHYFTAINWTTFLHRCPTRLTFAKMLESLSRLPFPSSAFLCIFLSSFFLWHTRTWEFGVSGLGAVGLAKLQILWTLACSAAGASPQAGLEGGAAPVPLTWECGGAWEQRECNYIGFTCFKGWTYTYLCANGGTLYVRVWHLKTNWTYKMALKVNVKLLGLHVALL